MGILVDEEAQVRRIKERLAPRSSDDLCKHASVGCRIWKPDELAEEKRKLGTKTEIPA
jgi:hypothetical protein